MNIIINGNMVDNDNNRISIGRFNGISDNVSIKNVGETVGKGSEVMTDLGTG